MILNDLSDSLCVSTLPNTPRLRFRGFTEPWEKKKLGEVAEIRRGLTYSPNDVSSDLNSVRVLRSSNINEDRLVLSDEDVFVRREAINIPFVSEGDILITSANGSASLVGKHCIIEGVCSGTCVPGGFMLCASTDNPYFLQASMSSTWYQQFITTHAAGGGGSIGNLNKTLLEEQYIPFPSLAEQEKIGTFFREQDEGIAAVVEQIDKLKTMKQACLSQMFA